MNTDRKERYLFLAVKEVVQNNALAILLAICVLGLLPQFVTQNILYAIGIRFIASMFAPFFHDWLPRSRLSSEGKTVLITGREEGKHLQSVVLLLSRHTSDALLGYDCINERFLTSIFKTKIKGLNVICCYASTSDENEKDKFYSQLHDILNSVKKGDISLVLGNLNAKVGTDFDLWGGILGPFGIGGSNGNMERLLQVCELHFAPSDVERETSMYDMKTGRKLSDH